MKNTCPFYIVFQVLKVRLIKVCKINHHIFYFLLFLLAFTSVDIIFHKCLELHSTLSEKRFSSQIILFNGFSQDATTLDTGESQETNKQKIVVTPQKKRQQVWSNKEALSEVANSLKVMAETSLRHFKMMAEEDKRREGRYKAFQREDTEKNWEHELCIAEIFVRAAQLIYPPNSVFSHFLIGHTSTQRA